MQPTTLRLDFQSGVIEPCNNYSSRHLSDMVSMYADANAAQELGHISNPLLYEVYQHDVPFESGQLLVVTTIIHPGKVGDEYFMTKGHFHSRRDTAEVYVGLQGHGYLLMCTEEGDFRSIEFRPGTIGYIPPFWAHRMANVGGSDFVFYGTYPGDAGHDYGTIEKRGFPRILVERSGKPMLVVNSNYVRS